MSNEICLASSLEIQVAVLGENGGMWLLTAILAIVELWV